MAYPSKEHAGKNWEMLKREIRNFAYDIMSPDFGVQYKKNDQKYLIKVIISL